jgi:hypothetical protein
MYFNYRVFYYHADNVGLYARRVVLLIRLVEPTNYLTEIINALPLGPSRSHVRIGPICSLKLLKYATDPQLAYDLHV